jgi:DNA-binding transcriptional MerR regulator
MLRNYDEIGLLKPCFVDNSSGYRYYSEEQLLEANQIQALKAMGFGLKEITQALRNGIRTEVFHKLMEDKAKEKRNEIIKLTRQLKQIENSLNEFYNKGEFSCCISVKTIPARRVVSYRAVIKEFSDEGILWTALMEECSKQKVQFVVPEYSMAIEHMVDFENNLLEVEVQRAVDKLYEDTEQVKFLEVPEILAASLTYQGGYSRINVVNPYVAKWILENNYEISGAAFNIYHISPGNEENEDSFITEVCFPIKIRD